MRVVIQRVLRASVTVEGQVVGAIDHGLLVLLGIQPSDNQTDLDFLVEKTINLRIFSDDEGKMNLSVRDVTGGILVVSQFTLYGDCRKGRRPSFIAAAGPEQAQSLYNQFVARLKESNLQVETGIFAADMKVELVNDGPVTLIIDSPDKQIG
jgi:D-tyrosyl-tRNA(Tyr) deacylase